MQAGDEELCVRFIPLSVLVYEAIVEEILQYDYAPSPRPICFEAPPPPRIRRAHPPRIRRAHPPRIRRAHPPRIRRVHPARPACAVQTWVTRPALSETRAPHKQPARTRRAGPPRPACAVRARPT